ncbi:MAG: hypothetical protein IPH57_17480 [Saprospiraceae bacterium]|nr:hypothetical protein [Saprospiraceae bacterium]
MIKKIVFVCIIILISKQYLHGQVTNDTLFFDRFSVGISPSALINSFSGAQVNFNIGLTPKLKFVVETGYIFNSVHAESANGYRLKYGIEWMLQSRRNAPFIMGLNGIHRYVTEQRSSTVFYPENYSEIVKYEKTKTMQGFQISLGQYFRLNQNFKMSYLLGLGIGGVSVEDIGEDAVNDFVPFFNFYNRAGKYNYPVISVNIKYMYTLATFK